MYGKLTRRQMLKLSASFAAAAFLSSCGPKATEAPTAEVSEEEPLQDAPTQESRELLKLTVMSSGDRQAEKAINNPSDIVTPYFEKMFDFELDISVPPEGHTMEEIFALRAAAGDVPDIFGSHGRSGAQQLVAMYDFVDMTDYLPDMPNYTRYIHQPTWPRFTNEGRHYLIPNLGIDGLDPKYEDNIYQKGFNVWPLMAREDILARCGYTFTPLYDIAKDTTEKGIWPTLDQLAIEPAIDTPEKFEELLRKIKALNITIAGAPLAPLNSTGWSYFHISNMMDNGHWRISDEGEVDGYFGTPDAKEWMWLWSGWYQDDLLDKDYLVQKDDQLQTKWANGRVGVGVVIPNISAARQALLAEDETAVVRPIPWPKKNDRYGFYDVFETGWTCMIFNKTIEQHIPRIVEIIDFMSSEEGQAIRCWGPPEAGLYVTGSDGKKQWKDEETRKNIMENVADTHNADYYGLESPLSNAGSRISWAIPHGPSVEADPRLNYPPQLVIEDVVPKVFSLSLNIGYNLDGRVNYGDGGENCDAVSGVYWGFITSDLSRALEAKSEDEFNTVWDQLMQEFNTEGKYPEAKADMERWFAEFGPEGLREKVKTS